MRRLKLYEEPPALAAEACETAHLDRGCALCPLSKAGAEALVTDAEARRVKCIVAVEAANTEKKLAAAKARLEVAERSLAVLIKRAKATNTRSPCMNPEGKPGGLYVVGTYPGVEEDAGGRPFTASAARAVRDVIKAHWNGPVAFDYAVRCAPGAAKVDHRNVDACRPYLADIWKQVRPQRVITLGAAASEGVAGRSVQTAFMRRGYTYSADGVPVFFLQHPSSVLRNRFDKARWTSDMLWALTATPKQPPIGASCSVVETPADSALACAELRADGLFAFDVESAGGPLHDEAFRLISLACWSARGGYVWLERGLIEAEVSAPLVALLADPSVGKIAHNAKFDVAACTQHFGRRVEGLALDTLLAAKLLDPLTQGRLAIQAERVGMGGHKEEAEELHARAVKAMREADEAAGEPLAPSYDALAYDALPTDVLVRYNARDALATERLGAVLTSELAAEPDLARTWKTNVLPAVPAFAQIEAWGIRVDRDRLNDVGVLLRGQIGVYEDALRRLTSPEFRPSALADVRAVLFGSRADGGFGLKPVALTDGGDAQADKDVLLDVVKQGGKAAEFATALLNWRRSTKLLSTYVDSLVPWIRSTGRVHASYNLAGTETGRPSAQNPNLLNIPRPETVEGKAIRDVFAAEPGWTLVQGDLSQAELRVAAGLSCDKAMRAVFESGVDFHTQTAKLIAREAWGIAPEAVEKKHRSAAKAVNFGLLYGKGTRSLARDLGVTFSQAERFVALILGGFPDLDRWLKAQVREAHSTGHVWTYWEGRPARRRPLFGVADPDDGVRLHAEHAAVNTPVQGTASDYCLAALIEIVDWALAQRGDARVVLTVYDSIVLEVRNSLVPTACSVLKEAMQRRRCNGVPMVADVAFGTNWGSLEDVKEEAAA